LQIVRPQLELISSPGEVAAPLMQALAEGPLAKVRRVDIVDGALRLPAGEDGPLPGSFSAIDLTGTREGEHGFLLEGSASANGEPVRLTIKGGRLAFGEPVAVTAGIEIGPRARPAALTFSGELRPDPAGLQAGGTLKVDTERGSLPPSLAPGVQLAGILEAQLAARPGRVTLADLELTVGEGLLRGTADIAWETDPRVEIALEGVRFVATPEVIDALCQAYGAVVSRPGPSVRATLQLAALTWRGGEIRRLRAEAGIRPDGQPELRRLEATLPGEAALVWTGAGPGAADEPLLGEVSLQAADLRGLLIWLGVAAADLPAGGLTSLDLTAQARLGADRIDLSGLRARLDASQIAGSLAYMGPPRPRLDAALTASRLNTALYAMPLAAWTDWQARIAALDGSVDLKVDQLSHDTLRGQGFRLRGGLVSGSLDLAELSVADFAGAALDVRGTIDLLLGAWDLTGVFTVREPKSILRQLGVDPPLEIGRLAPLRLEGQSRREASKTSLALHLAARNAEASLVGKLEGQPVDGALELTAMADASDAGELLLALGWPAQPDRAAFGPLSARAEIRRDARPFQVELEAKVGGSELTADADLTIDAARPRFAGALRAPLLDTALAAALYETLAMPFGFPPGNPLLWPGVWPKRPLAWDWLRALDLEVTTDVARLRHRGEHLGGVRMTAALADGRLALSDLQLPVAGGALTGVVTLESKNDHAILGTDIKLVGARAEELAAAFAPGSSIQGSLDLEAALLAQGRSIADLVASLTGSGDISLRAARLPDVEAGPAAAATLSGPFSVAEGMLESAPPGLALAFPGGTATLGLRLDLLAWILEASLDAGGSTRRFLGPPGRIRLLPSP
jgi:hypothetical protein